MSDTAGKSTVLRKELRSARYRYSEGNCGTLNGGEKNQVEVQ